MDEQKTTVTYEANFIDDNLNEWSDEECLMNFTKFLSRVRLMSGLTQNEEGAFVGKKILLICGDLFIESDTVPLEWPLMIASMPEGYNAH